MKKSMAWLKIENGESFSFTKTEDHPGQKSHQFSTMISEFILFGQAEYLDQSLEVLANLLREYFEKSGLNTRPFLDGSYGERSDGLSHMVRAQYKEVREIASHLSISPPM